MLQEIEAGNRVNISFEEQKRPRTPSLPSFGLPKLMETADPVRSV
jgi:hypothetical protein